IPIGRRERYHETGFIRGSGDSRGTSTKNLLRYEPPCAEAEPRLGAASRVWLGLSHLVNPHISVVIHSRKKATGIDHIRGLRGQSADLLDAANGDNNVGILLPQDYPLVPRDVCQIAFENLEICDHSTLSKIPEEFKRANVADDGSISFEPVSRFVEAETVAHARFSGSIIG